MSIITYAVSLAIAVMRRNGLDHVFVIVPHWTCTAGSSGLDELDNSSLLDSRKARLTINLYGNNTAIHSVKVCALCESCDGSALK